MTKTSGDQSKPPVLPTKKLRRRWRYLFYGVLVLFLFVISFPRPLLRLRHHPEPADAIVVLGGFIGDRMPQALHLLKQGYSDRILLTGEGHLSFVTNWFENAQVSLDSLHLETAATSTYENAKFSESFIREWGCRKVILVTSEFHSRRALCVFQRQMPDIHFISVPPEVSSEQSKFIGGSYLRVELVKIVGYWLVHKVPPWTM